MSKRSTSIDQETLRDTMADEDLEAGAENVSLDDDKSSSGEDADTGDGDSADESEKKKKRPTLKLPLGLTPIILGMAVLAIASTVLSLSAFMKTQSYKALLATALESARDPANLGYYQEANLTFLAAKTYEPDKAVVILGSDLGHHWEILDVLREDAVVNRSIAKQSYSQMMLRFEQDVICLDPQTVVLMPPLDSVLKPKWLVAQTRVLGEVALEMGVQPIITTIAPIPQRDDEIAGGYIGRIRATNRSLKKLSQEKSWPCLDLYEVLVGEDQFLDPTYVGDELWPNAHGYGDMTRALESLLDSLTVTVLAQQETYDLPLRSAER